jgi:hypothetical protein
MNKPKSDSPSARTLRELPEVDVARYRVRRNPFAARIAREGIEVVHEEPSPRSLAEMPEADFSLAHVRGNPYTSRAAGSLPEIQYGRGRPRAGAEVGPTPGRTVRLPESAWHALDVEAKEKHTTVHALLRELVMTHLDRRAARGRR